MFLWIRTEAQNMYLYLGHICFTAQNMRQESYDQLEWVHEPGSGQIHAIP